MKDGDPSPAHREGVMTTRGKDPVRWAGLRWALTGVWLFAAAACSQSSPAPAPPDSGARPGAASSRAEIKIAGVVRSYRLYAPSSLHSGAPLLFVFHGSGQDGEGIERSSGFAFDRLADRDGFAVVYPDGYEGNWNDCRQAAFYPARRLHIDDKLMVRAVIARLVKERGIDPHKVFAMGHSDGGQMVFRLALEQPGDLAGVAAVSASLPTPENMDCAAVGQPLPIMIINGTDDAVSPYGGGLQGSLFALGLGDRGTIQSTEATAAYFDRLNGQTGAPQTARLPHQDPADPTWVEEEGWTAPGKAPVVLYTIHGGGHVLPQPYNRYPVLMGRQTNDIDAPTLIWDFFSAIANPPKS